MNIVLLGYRCTGKTSVGRILADKLRRPFFDTDEMIQTSTGKTVREMVEDGGWAVFRREERRVVQDVAARDGSVIALGGGAVLERENVRNLSRSGFFVWLTADARTIEERLSGDGKNPDQRPPLSGVAPDEETESLLKIREPFYAKISDLRVDTSDRKTEEITEEILAALQGTAEFDPKRRRAHGR